MSSADRSESMSHPVLFKWKHFQPEIILLNVRWYCRYALSYRDLEEMMAERGLSVDHSTINRLCFSRIFLNKAEIAKNLFCQSFQSFCKIVLRQLPVNLATISNKEAKIAKEELI